MERIINNVFLIGVEDWSLPTMKHQAQQLLDRQLAGFAFMSTGRNTEK